MTSGQPRGDFCAVQTDAGTIDANMIKNILFTAGFPKAFRCRTSFYRYHQTGACGSVWAAPGAFRDGLGTRVSSRLLTLLLFRHRLFKLLISASRTKFR